MSMGKRLKNVDFTLEVIPEFRRLNLTTLDSLDGDLVMSLLICAIWFKWILPMTKRIRTSW